jgi:energy-coupling factor transport system permease protein
LALRDITLGQYFPGSSVIHRFDPRAKLIFILFFVAATFIANGPVSYATVLAVLILGIILSTVRFSVFRRGLRPVLVIVIFTAVMNLFFSQSGDTLVSWGIFHITTGGVRHAVYMMLRIIMLLLSTLLLTYTTSPLALTDGLEHLMRPLKALKVPVHDFAMIMGIALRFIPTLIQETDKIISAQKARGADFESGNIFRRAKALVPILIPLFVSAFRRAEELSVAMDCRCYNGSGQRTRLRELQFAPRDLFLLTLVILLCAGVILLRILGF